MFRIALLVISTLLIIKVQSQEATLVTQQRDLGTITDFIYSANGEYLANVSDGDHVIKIWHLASGKIIGSLQGHKNRISHLAYSKDGNSFFSVDEDDFLIHWDLQKWEMKDTVQLDSKVTAICYNNERKEIIIAFENNDIYILSSTLTNKRTIKGTNAYLNALKAEGDISYGISAKGEIVFIDLALNKLSNKSKITKSTLVDLEIDFKNQLFYAITQIGEVISGELATLNTLTSINPFSGIGNKTIALNFNSKRLAYVSGKRTIDLFSLTGEKLFSLTLSESEADNIKKIGFSPDGSILSSSGFRKNLIGDINSQENAISVWDLERRSLLKSLKGTVNAVVNFSFHPQDNQVAILGENNIVSFWDINFAEKIGEFQLPIPKLEQKIQLLTEDEKRESSNSVFGTDLRVPDLNTLGKKVQKNLIRRTTNRTIRKEPILFKYSSKGTYLITKLEKDEVRIYTVNGDELTYRYFAQHGQERINNFITDPEEKFLICLGAGNQAVSVVDLTTGKLIQRLKTENQDANYEFLNNAMSAAYNPKGTDFAVCTGRGQIFVWNSSFYQLFKTDGTNVFRAGKNAFINYSSDGSTIYLSGLNGVRGYNIETFNPFSIDALQLKGFPFELSNPQDYLVSFEEGKGYIENIKTRNLATFPIQRELINKVDGSSKGFLGIALKTGEFILYNPMSGEEAATFIGEGENTIIKTKGNFYRVNKEGFDLVSFRIGKKAYPFEQFDAYYNRPDIILEALNCDDKEYIQLYKNAYNRRLEKLGISAEKPDFNTLPQLSINNRNSIPFSTKESFIELDLKGNGKGEMIDYLRIEINNVPVETVAINAMDFDKKQSIELISGHNQVGIIAVSKSGKESLLESVDVLSARDDKPTLYIVAVGTSLYKDKRFNLSYAAKDATDFVQLYTSKNPNYAEVKSLTLTNNQVKIEAFSGIKEFLKTAKRNDEIIFYIAGHGVLDNNYNYYYGTHDMDFMAPQKRGLAYSSLEEYLKGLTTARKLLIMDTCHSGEVEADEVEEDTAADDVAFEDISFRSVGPKLRETGNTKASPGKMARLLFADIRKGTGATVISSAGGVEFAMEGADWKNGLFTYCLLNGLTNKTADLNKDGTIMLSELQTYLIENVGKLSHGRQVPTTRVQNIRQDYPVWKN
jgi:WD40 repeat protein